MAAKPDRPVELTIIGVAADGEMSRGGRALVEKASAVFGSPRLLKAVLPKMRANGKAEIIDWQNDGNLQNLKERLRRRKGAVALASGDPMFYGLGSCLAGNGEFRLKVLPTPSSASLAAARLGWAMETTQVVSLHGGQAARKLSALRKHLANGRKLLVLTDPRQNAAGIADFLQKEGYGKSRLYLLEALGGPEEKLIRFVDAAAAKKSNPTIINVVGIDCVFRGFDPLAQPFGIAAERYLQDRGQISKPTTRSAILAMLGPIHGQLLWDIGSGSGSVAIEWMRAADCRAIAIEASTKRAAQIRKNAERMGTPHLRVVHGNSPKALAGLEAPNAIFIGGGEKTAALFALLRRKLIKGGRLAAVAVTRSSEEILTAQYCKYGGSLVRLRTDTAEGPIKAQPLKWRPGTAALIYRWLKK